MNKINFIRVTEFNDGSIYLNEGMNLLVVNLGEKDDPIVVEPPKK